MDNMNMNNMNMNNMNNMNCMNNAMNNMNQMMGWNYNMNQFNQFMQMVNSNPVFLMMFNQMMQMQNCPQCVPNMMMNSQFMPNNNQNMMNTQFINGGSPNMQFPQNNMNNMQIQQNRDPFKINLNFKDTTETKRAIIIAEPNEPMTSVINKYINKTGDISATNLYIFNGKRIVQSLTVSELGITDGSEIYVSDIKNLEGGIKNKYY